MSCKECSVYSQQCGNLILDAERLCIVYNDVRTAKDVWGSILPIARAAPEFSIRHVSNTKRYTRWSFN